MNLGIILLGIILLVPMGISFWYSLRLFLTDINRVTLNFFGVVLSVEIWVISVLIMTLNLPADIVSHEIISLLGRFGLFIIYFGAFGISRAYDQPFYGRDTRPFAFSALTIFILLLSLVTIDIVLPQPFFFILEYNRSEWQVAIHPLASFLTFLGFFSIVGTIYFSSKKVSSIPNFLSAKNNFRIALLLATVPLLGYFAGLIFTVMIASLTLPAFYYLILAVLITLNIFIIVYFSHDQPFLFLGGGLQPKLLLERGNIGYLLCTWSDYGPNPLLVSPEFIEFSNLSDESLLNLAIKVISTTGLDRMRPGHIALVPVPYGTDLVALAVTFPFKNPNILNKDLKDHAPSMFAILFPSLITIGFNHMHDALPIILDKINQKENILELAEHRYLQEIVITVFRRLIS